LLESALLSFVQHGLHATSTATLARAAALSKGGLYRTIRSKAELIKAVYAYAIGQLQAPLLTPTGQVQPYERLQPLLTRWWQLTATAAQAHPDAFAYWRLYRTSRFAFGFGKPLLGPFA
jgi:AcrR family transcriptional regulator